MQEEELVGVILAFDSRKRPLNNQTILYIANSLVSERATPLTISWLDRFNERWKSKFTMRKVQSISDKRSDKSTLKNVTEWIQNFEEYIYNHGIDRDFFINADETRISIAGSLFTGKRAVATGK